MTAELDSAEGASGEKKEEGESLLLPLIQGILQNPKYHKLSARQLLNLNLSQTISAQSGLLSPSSSKMNSEHNQLNASNGLGNDCLPIEDSGTESGEDLRLLAAGLQSSLSMDVTDPPQEAASNQVASPLLKGKNDALNAALLMEVTTALARLQTSLNLGEIDLDESKKVALLSLVNRLQCGLISPEKITEASVDSTDSAVSVNGQSPMMETPPETTERRGSSSGVGRFAKRRNRVNRHTVGVTKEELNDARRIIEELELIGMRNSTPNLNKPKITATVVNSKPGIYNAILMRQFSEPITLLRPSQFVPKEANQQIELPIKSKFKVFKHSVSLDQPVSILKTPVKPEAITKLEPIAPFVPKKFSLQRNTSGTNNKFPVNNHKASEIDAPTDESSSSESDDDNEMVNTKYYNNSAASKFNAKENYLRNQQNADRSFNCYSSGDETSTPGPRQPKYTSKKMKMKRANTVNIPKSFSFVNTFDLADRDCSDNESSKHGFSNRGSNAGLRTTITSGDAPSKLPPQFTPKTENDKKFLAFIQKQNTNVTPSYVNPSASRNANTPNWNNKFGNLKNRFQNDEPLIPKGPPKVASNAAANFWKSIEKDKPVSKVSPLPPVPVIQTMKNLPIVSDKFPWKSPVSEKIISTEEPIVMRKKQMMEKFVPTEAAPPVAPRVIHEPNKLPVLKPTSVNNFSHAPLSAFKPPISRKLSNSFKPIQTTEEVIKKPLPQVSNGHVRQLAETGYSVNNNPLPQPRKIISSPTRSIADSSFIKATKPLEKADQPAPWGVGKPKSERVLSLAASKFENVPTVHLSAILHHTPPEPAVKYRNNPLYNGTFEKRSSLPPNASYATFEPSMYATQSVTNVSAVPKEVTYKISPPKDKTFTITDFTQPTLVSTYTLPQEKVTRPAYNRQESLTNPDLEPLVLTCNRTVFSPKDSFKPKPMELYEISTPNSSTISKDHSIASICDDLENELQEIGAVECNVAVSKVMVGPVAQTAYTQSSELTSLNSEGKENSMMKSLQDSLKKLSQKSPTPEKRKIDVKRSSQDSPNSPMKMTSSSGSRQIEVKRSSQDSPVSPFKETSSNGSRQVDVKRLSQDSSNSSIDMKAVSPFKGASSSGSRLSQDSSNSSIDLPPFKIPIPAVPETSYSITYASPPKIQVKSPSIGPNNHVVYNNTSQQSHGFGLQKSLSSHMLSIPKPTDPAIPPPQAMYGASQSQVAAKQKSMQSYFGPKRAESLAIRPKPTATSYVRPVTFSVKPQPSSQPSAIAKKISMYSKPASSHAPLNSLARSKTMPSLANVELLDESNIDDAFEELLGSTNL